MSQIVSIRVLVGDAVKHTPGDQYSLSRKAEVELTSSVESGQEAESVLNWVISLAEKKVVEILSGPRHATDATAFSDAKVAPALAPSTPAPPVAGSAGAAKAGKKRGRPPGKAKKAAEPATDPDTAPEPPTEITDQDLTDACQALNLRIKDGARIRKITASYVSYDDRPATCRDIPNEKRQAFLDELTAIK